MNQNKVKRHIDPRSFRYYTPPFIINGYVCTLGIKRMDDKKEPYQFTLFQCDTHHSNYTEELPITAHLTPDQQESFINLCVHYHNNFSQCKMIMFKTINHQDMQFELNFKIHLEKPTMIIQQCKDSEMIANYDLFLQKSQFEDWDTHSTQTIIYKLILNDEIRMSKPDTNLKSTRKYLSTLMNQLHGAKKYYRIKDHASNKNYMIYFYGITVYIVSLIANDFPVINWYNIRKRNIDIVIYNELILCLTKYSEYILIISLQTRTVIGKVRTHIQRTRLNSHFIVNKRLINTRYIAIFGGIAIPHDISVLINLFIDTHHFKYELILYSKYTCCEDSADEEFPICINMNTIMQHLQYLCLA